MLQTPKVTDVVSGSVTDVVAAASTMQAIVISIAGPVAIASENKKSSCVCMVVHLITLSKLF